jgi:ribosomal protein L11 methyltransferase
MIPYQNLYIYEISGEISGSRNFFKEDFIGCWNEGETSFLFFLTPHDEEVEALVDKKGMELVSKNVLDYKAWQAGEELKPFKVGNLTICPPWESWAVEEGEILVYLDPCVVFGTGYHPTTRSCLKALWEIYQKEKPKRVLDLGTGSGILALAAAKWGAEKILAIDCNELAVETTLRNVEFNRESHRIVVKQGRAENFIKEEADLVCANIHFRIIKSLLSKKAFFKKRWFILSGVFLKDAEEIEGQLNQRFVQTYQKILERNWVTWVGLNWGFKKDKFY